MQSKISLDKDQIAAFCEKHHIVKLALFGSVLTDRFGPDSDVDMLFEYDLNRIPTLLDVVDMEAELSTILGRKVDLRTPGDLSRYFGDEVIQTALVPYAA